MNALALSIIRTYVPIIVGGFASWLLATFAFNLEAETQVALIVALTGLLQAAYYAGVRALEERFPGVGILLGAAKSPDSYSKGSEPAQAVAGPAGDLPASEDVVLPDLTVPEEKSVTGL